VTPEAASFVVRGSDLSLSNHGQLELMRAVLGRGLPFRTMVRGSSMSPFIRDEDVLTVTSLGGHRPRVGDIIAFTLPGAGRLVIHRIVASDEDGWQTRGDNCRGSDGVVIRGQIVGRVVRCARDGRRIRIGVEVGGAWVAALSRHGLISRAGSTQRAVLRAGSGVLRQARRYVSREGASRRIELEADSPPGSPE
jgi:signal peptidase I